jgi:hypothetical protein
MTMSVSLVRLRTFLFLKVSLVSNFLIVSFLKNKRVQGEFAAGIFGKELKRGGGAGERLCCPFRARGMRGAAPRALPWAVIGWPFGPRERMKHERKVHSS